jgi:hypothetical protein
LATSIISAAKMPPVSAWRVRTGRVRNEPVEPRQGGSEQHDLHDVEQHADTARHRADQATRGGDRIGGDGQAGGEQQRAERDGGPVDHHPLGQRTRPLHAPDAVERAVDREHQRERRHQQRRQPGHAQPARLARELREVAEHLARDRIRHQAFHQPALQAVLQLAEHRERGEHRQRHGEKRHQRDGGGEGQAARGEAEPVLAEALAERQRGGLPREGREVGGELAQVHRPL